MKRLLGFPLAVSMLMIAAGAIARPVSARQSWSAYPDLIRMHQSSSTDLVVNGRQPFLCVSWFRGGSLEAGWDFAIYDAGNTAEHLFRRQGVKGGMSPALDRATFAQLQSISDLPPAPAHSEPIPQSYMLFVTLRKNGKFVSRVYDRQQIPAGLIGILKAAGVEALPV